MRERLAALAFLGSLSAACAPAQEPRFERCTDGEYITSEVDKIRRAADSIPRHELEEANILYLGRCSCAAYDLAIDTLDRREALPEDATLRDLIRIDTEARERRERMHVIEHARDTHYDREDLACRIRLDHET